MKIRSALAAVALAGTVAPLAATPAQAMTCAEGFEAVCWALGTACVTVASVPLPDKLDVHCELH